MANLPVTIVTQEVESPNAAADGMRQTLYTLEAQEQELAAKMQESHPRLVAVRSEAQDRLTRMGGRRDAAGPGPGLVSSLTQATLG